MSPTLASWEVLVGQPFTAVLPDPDVDGLGARVEVPLTRAIISSWREAVRQDGVATVVLDGPLVAGAYQLVWMDGASVPVFEEFQPIVAVEALTSTSGGDYPHVDLDHIRPSVDDVAQLLRTRTVGEGGSDEGTFNDATTPTGDEVSEIIDQSVDDVVMQLPANQVNPSYYRQLSRVITYHAAIMIEQSYFREQADAAAVGRWERLESAAIQSLSAAVSRDLHERDALTFPVLI